MSLLKGNKKSLDKNQALKRFFSIFILESDLNWIKNSILIDRIIEENISLK